MHHERSRPNICSPVATPVGQTNAASNCDYIGSGGSHANRTTAGGYSQAVGLGRMSRQGQYHRQLPLRTAPGPSLPASMNGTAFTQVPSFGLLFAGSGHEEGDFRPRDTSPECDAEPQNPHFIWWIRTFSRWGSRPARRRRRPDRSAGRPFRRTVPFDRSGCRDRRRHCRVETAQRLRASRPSRQLARCRSSSLPQQSDANRHSSGPPRRAANGPGARLADLTIAAKAGARELTVLTWKVGDFAPLDIPAISPFESLPNRPGRLLQWSLQACSIRECGLRACGDC